MMKLQLMVETGVHYLSSIIAPTVYEYQHMLSGSCSSSYNAQNHYMSAGQN